MLNPAGQYADDRNLRARQRLWQCQRPAFDVVGWVLDLAGLRPGQRVLDVGCGNGEYLAALAVRPVRSVGCDLSLGMLRPLAHRPLINADVTALPVRDGSFDVVLAAHMLYHVPDRVKAASELRRVLAPGGSCVAVTNGARQLRELRGLVEAAVRRATPGWRLEPATHTFTAENAAAQLGTAFTAVSCVRPDREPPVVIQDAAVAAEYVASWADFYDDQTSMPWPEVVQEVHRQVQAAIERDGAYLASGDLAAFVCR